MAPRLNIILILLSWTCILEDLFGTSSPAKKNYKIQLSLRVAKPICAQTSTFAASNKIQPAIKQEVSTSQDQGQGKDNLCKIVTWTTLCESETCTKFKLDSCLETPNHPSPLKHIKRIKQSVSTKDLPSLRIVEGSQANPNEFPSVVRLVHAFTHQTICGGVIVNTDHILTAASCLNDISESDLIIISGDHNIYQHERTEKIFLTKSIILHPEYDCFTRQFDLAVVQTLTPFDFSKNKGTNQADLHHTAFSQYQHLTLAGWGTTQNGCQPDILQKAEITSFPNKNLCKIEFEKTEFQSFEDKMCADPNQGWKNLDLDQGSPLLDTAYNPPVLVGIALTPHDSKLQKETTAVFQEIASVANFVIDTIGDPFLSRKKQRRKRSVSKSQNIHNNNKGNQTISLKGRTINNISNSLKFTPRILHGSDSNPHEFPYQVRIVEGKSHRTICGGAIITPFDILTSASCIKNLAPWDIIVFAGERDASRSESSEQIKASAFVQTHKCYNPKTRQGDLALLKLQSELKFVQEVSAVQLPQRGFQATGDAILTGWGTVTGMCQPETLQKIRLPIIDDNHCRSQHKSKGSLLRIADDMLCTGQEEGERQGPCTGDGGSPLVIETNTGKRKFTLVGIASVGENCMETIAPPIYTKISHYIKWIESLIEKVDEGEEEIVDERKRRKKKRSLSLRNTNLNGVKNTYIYHARIVNLANHNNLCGGAIITSNLVLTSAQCVLVITTSDIVVIAGEYSLKFLERTEQAAYVENVIFHPEYDTITEANDLAILVLKKSFVFTRAVGDVMLAPKSFASKTEGVLAMVTGWGITHQGCRADELQEIEVVISKCTQHSLDYDLGDKHICTAQTSPLPIGHCENDMKGPLVLPQIGGSFFLLGMYSFGSECGALAGPSAYTDISKQGEFIEKVIAENLQNSRKK